MDRLKLSNTAHIANVVTDLQSSMDRLKLLKNPTSLLLPMNLQSSMDRLKLYKLLLLKLDLIIYNPVWID